MQGLELVTASLGQTPETVVLARVDGEEILEVIDNLDYSADACKTLLAKRNELRATSALADRLEVLAVVHDCDAHPVPYVSDGPLGHGWECGVCGAFLQAG